MLRNGERLPFRRRFRAPARQRRVFDRQGKPVDLPCPLFLYKPRWSSAAGADSGRIPLSFAAIHPLERARVGGIELEGPLLRRDPLFTTTLIYLPGDPYPIPD
jgi:hypothetical protein